MRRVVRGLGRSLRQSINYKSARKKTILFSKTNPFSKTIPFSKTNPFIEEKEKSTFQKYLQVLGIDPNRSQQYARFVSPEANKALLKALQANPTIINKRFFSSVASGSGPTFLEAHQKIYGNTLPVDAYLGTGPVALSMIAQRHQQAKTEGVIPSISILFTQQEELREILETEGFIVEDERNSKKIRVNKAYLRVVGSAEEYHERYKKKLGDPTVVIGSQQMNQYPERWGIVGEDTKLAFTAANGPRPFTTMQKQLENNSNIELGHMALYVKVRSEKKPDVPFKVITTDNGIYSFGLLNGKEQSSTSGEEISPVFTGELFEVKTSKDPEGEAMDKAIRNLTNVHPFLATLQALQEKGACKRHAERKVLPVTYGSHLEEKKHIQGLIELGFEAASALDLSSEETATQTVENILYIAGENGSELGDKSQFHKTVKKEIGRKSLKEASKNIASYVFGKIGNRPGSGHPPTDAQHASLSNVSNKKGGIMPVKPVENKVEGIIEIGLSNNIKEKEMKKLRKASKYFDRYNEAVRDKNQI